MQRNLLFVVNVDWFFWSHRLPIALEAQRQGFRVHIATRLTGLQAQIESLGLVVHPLAAMNRSSTGLGDACRTVAELWRLYKAVRPDVVHLVTIKPVLLGGLVARFAGVPAVVMAVSGLGFVFTATGFKALPRRWIVTALYRLAFGHRNLKIIFQNASDQLTLTKSMGLSQGKIKLIRGSGVDLTVFIVKSDAGVGVNLETSDCLFSTKYTVTPIAMIIPTMTAIFINARFIVF